MKELKLNNTELFYLEDFVQKEWFKYIDTIVDKNNMNELDKDIYKTLLQLSEKIRKLRKEKI